MPTYVKSAALQGWFGDRCADLAAVEEAHRRVAQATPGAGRPLSRGGDHIAHAFIVRMYAEFQGFVRELHDIAVIAFVRGSEVAVTHRAPIIHAATDGRRLDLGNAGLQVIKQDFRRIGLSSLGGQLANLNPRHVDDKARYEELTELRNALAHGNADQLRALRAKNIKPTMTWGRSTRSSLNRMARALDRSVWDHVVAAYPNLDPWGTS